MRVHDFQIRTHDERGDSVTITTFSGVVLVEDKFMPCHPKAISIGTGPIVTGRPMRAAAKWIVSRFSDCLDDEIILWRGTTKCLSSTVRNVLGPPLATKEPDEDAGA